MRQEMVFNWPAVVTVYEDCSRALAGGDWWPKREAVERAIDYVQARPWSRPQRQGRGPQPVRGCFDAALEPAPLGPRGELEILKTLRAARDSGRCRPSVRPDAPRRYTRPAEAGDEQ